MTKTKTMIIIIFSMSEQQLSIYIMLELWKENLLYIIENSIFIFLIVYFFATKKNFGFYEIFYR